MIRRRKKEPEPEAKPVKAEPKAEVKEAKRGCEDCLKAQAKIQQLKDFLIDIRDNVVSGNPSRVESINRLI